MGLGWGVRRRLFVKPKVKIMSFGLLSVGACTRMRQKHMNALAKIYHDRASYRERGQTISFDENPNGQENVRAVKDALASANRIDPGGCNIVMDCLVFFEKFGNIKGDEDVYFEHCGQHPQNIRRLLNHKGGRTMQRFMDKYHDQFMALTERLKEERRAYARGARQAAPEVACICVCKSGRDRSVGLATVLQCVLTGGGKWNVVVEHLCRSHWRENTGCQINMCGSMSMHCTACEQPQKTSADEVSLARGRTGKLAPGLWAPPKDDWKTWV